MKQTAVEWLVDQMLKRGYFEKDKPLTFTNLDHLMFEAKEMEKQQIIDAHIEGQRVFDKHPHTQWTNDQAEQYYSENYTESTK